MTRRTNPRKLEEFAELRSRGKTVAQASKAMKITERTGWRWNARIGLRDRNPEPEPVKRAGKVLGTPSEPEQAKIPGVPKPGEPSEYPDLDPSDWAEPFDPTEGDGEPVAEPVGQTVFPFEVLGFDEQWEALMHSTPDGSRKVDPQQLEAERRIAQDPAGTVRDPNQRGLNEASPGYRSPSAQKINPNTGLPAQEQMPDPRFAPKAQVEAWKRKHGGGRRSAVNVSRDKILGSRGVIDPALQVTRSSDPAVRASLAEWDRRTRENAGRELQRLEHDRRMRD